MTVKNVLKMGDPRLLEICKPVSTIDSAEMQALLQDMWDTMKAENGAGLAAPQIGVLRRVVIFGYQLNPRYPEAPPVPETVLINPEIKPLSEVMESDWEGCLSVPGMRGRVERYRDIAYRGHDAEGNLIEREVSGFHARVVQHECDHLDGILYPLKMHDLRYFGFLDTLLEHNRIPTHQPCDDDAQ